MVPTRKWGVALLLISALAAGLLEGGGCLSMPTEEVDRASDLIADSIVGTWLVSVDTANVAPFEVVLFNASNDRGSQRLLGVSRVPEFASRMGMTTIRPGPLMVTLDHRRLVFNGLVLGDRQLVFSGS